MQMVLSLLLAFVVCLVSSQRSPYAPNPIRYPQVANRFLVPETETENVGLGNRNGVPGVSTPSTTTVRLPIDARGNEDVVNQINNWPDDRRPFWYINREIIENSRARPMPAPGMNVQVNVPSRSSFLPSQ